IAPEELYHLPSDPKEQTNIVDKHPDLAMDFRAQIIEWLNTNKRHHKEYKLTKEAEERLRALGYLK
ncbi:sulfatase, partial [bacterium]|nr:sulfatase [bacterium]